MNQKWNLQDIRPAKPRARRPIAPTTERTFSSEPIQQLNREEIPSIVIKDGTRSGGKKIMFSVVLFLVVVGGAIALSALMGRTQLTIYPENREPNINSEFTAYPDKRDQSLSYTIMTLDATSESQVKASGQIEVKEQATGVVEIIKTTPGAERLIKNTRFRSPEGLIYRIQESVVVPGSVKDETGANVPGTIQAQVFADEVGEQYNLVAGTRFDIPGFKESGLDDLYSAIYAQNPQPFTGGFDGPKFQIDDSELSTARQALQIKLRDDLLARIEVEKPSGFIAFPGAVAITYNQLPAVEYGGDLVTIREQAVLQIPLFNASEIGAFLAKEAVATYSGGPVRISDPSVLTFAYTDPTMSSRIIANETSLSFSIKGKPLLIWEYDAKKLAADLATLPKSALNNAITAHPGIVGAKVSITPFWRTHFPENPDEIIIIEELKEPAAE